jgi:hypothetical protein
MEVKPMFNGRPLCCDAWMGSQITKIHKHSITYVLRYEPAKVLEAKQTHA